MRGVLSLAAAVSLPYALPDERTFPQRSMIIYLAFCLIVGPLFVRDWEHLRTEFESFPEFVALVASVHHMPPLLKPLTPK
jgi:hypothetical protein